ncbi:15139_t:CDS:1, partial [Cetraspora pellucida]
QEKEVPLINNIQNIINDQNQRIEELETENANLRKQIENLQKTEQIKINLKLDDALNKLKTLKTKLINSIKH